MAIDCRRQGRARATLVLPAGATAVVVFAHGSGSGRFSPRNQYVARGAARSGPGDASWSTSWKRAEADDRAHVFDIPLLAGRLAERGRLAGRRNLRRPGCAWAILGPAPGLAPRSWRPGTEPGSVGAIVSRGGRPDLARDVLPRVTAPTRLIVGGNDEIVLELNREAYELLQCPRQLDVDSRCFASVSRAGSPRRSRSAGQEWFLRYLTPSSP